MRWRFSGHRRGGAGCSEISRRAPIRSRHPAALREDTDVVLSAYPQFLDLLIFRSVVPVPGILHRRKLEGDNPPDRHVALEHLEGRVSYQWLTPSRIGLANLAPVLLDRLSIADVADKVEQVCRHCCSSRR